MAMCPPSGTPIHIFTARASEPLGTSDTDFSNVKVENYCDGELAASTMNYFYACTGKLGTLSGGLLHIPDLREQLTVDAVKEMREEEIAEKLSEKRTRGMRVEENNHGSYSNVLQKRCIQ